uniref:Uncharacterized protein n=1 Tax=Kalanchoe fedtschenkoi TaxID=63787 RepID=A0A7N1A0N6_KALFE
MRSGGDVAERARKSVEDGRRVGVLGKLLHSEEHEKSGNGVAGDNLPTLETLAIDGYAASGLSSGVGDAHQKLDSRDIEEAESSLRDGGCLNHEEARALLGRFEYQKGNVEAALHVFEGIDVTSVTSKMKLSLAGRGEQVSRHKPKRRSKKDSGSPMSIHAVSLILEAIYLKSKSLQALGRIKEAAQTCKVILDVIESSLPMGLPESFGTDCKLQETVNKAVELLPELWKFAECPDEAILSYRRGLLYRWNLDSETLARIEKEFAIFLLYSGGDASPPYLLSQMDGSYVPRNNIEEAILLFMILLRKMNLGLIRWDSSVMDHLSFAFSVSGELKSFAKRLEEMLPGMVDQKEWYYTLALCYYGAGEASVALDLLKKLLHSSQDPKHVPGLLLAAKICGESPSRAAEGIKFSERALQNLDGKCKEMISHANFFKGISLAAHCECLVSGLEKDAHLSGALKALDLAAATTNMANPDILYHMSVQYAEVRKLNEALYYAKHLLKLEGRSNIKSFLLLARILSAQQRYGEAEAVIDGALDETARWDQGELLRTKAKLQLAQGHVKKSLETYAQVLGVLQVQHRNSGVEAKLPKGGVSLNKDLELETWLDLARAYTTFSQWSDAEFCLSRAKAISLYCASTCHIIGQLLEAKGDHREALKSYQEALDLDPAHVPSLISTAMSLRRLSNQSHASVIRSFLTEALRCDRMNHTAWYSLGLAYRDQGPAFLSEAADCFQAAAALEETSPVEPLR